MTPEEWSMRYKAWQGYLRTYIKTGEVKQYEKALEIVQNLPNLIKPSKISADIVRGFMSLNRDYITSFLDDIYDEEEKKAWQEVYQHVEQRYAQMYVYYLNDVNKRLNPLSHEDEDRGLGGPGSADYMSFSN